MCSVHDNKEEVCNLIIRTGDKIITEDGNEEPSQDMVLEIGNKKFIFYGNYSISR